MLNFLEFILESTKVKVQYFYSVRFRQFLTEIVKSRKAGFEIANFILHSEQSNQIEDDITFIDMTDSNDKISFIQLNRVKRMYDLQKKEIEDDGKTVVISFEQWVERVAISEEANPWKNQRTDLYIGRFVNRVSVKGGKKLDPTEIENFVNTYKAKFDSFKSGESRFEEVSGEVIKHWYHVNNYEEVKGQLGNSCMRKENCQRFFNIYIQNPEVCSLLILKSEEDNDKICGRALIWNLTNGKTYMDRVYVIRDSDFQLFEEYAKSGNWQSEESMDSRDFSSMIIKLKHWKFDYYPYMDTFKYLNVIEGYLTSDDDRWPSTGFWRLESTSGEYDGDNLVWSEYHEEYISRDDAVQTLNGDFVYESEAVYLEYKSGYATKGEETAYSDYDGQTYYLDDTCYSEMMGDYIFIDEALEITINSDGDTDWIHEDMEERTFKIELEGEEVRTLPICTIFNPLDEKYYFKDDMTDNSRIINRIINSQELIPWEEVIKQILESDVKLEEVELPGGEYKFSALTNYKSSQKLEVLRSLKRENITNTIKCLLIISPDKSERRSSGEPLVTKGHRVFNNNLIEKYQNNLVLNGLLSEDFIKLLNGNWYWQEYAGKAAVQLSDYFISDVLKDPRAIATWYSIKMPH